MGLFDEIEKQAEPAVENQGGMGNVAHEVEQLINQQCGVEKLGNEAEEAVGGNSSEPGGLISEGQGLVGDLDRGSTEQRR